MKTSLILPLLILINLNGCSSDPEKPEPAIAVAPIPAHAPPPSINVRTVVSSKVNPDVNGQPSPIVIRLYELKSLGKFEESDFFSLSDNFNAQLGAELLGSEKYYVNPDDDNIKLKKLSPETQYIGVIAAFRNIDQAVWRDSVQITNGTISDILLYAEKLKISIWKK